MKLQGQMFDGSKVDFEFRDLGRHQLDDQPVMTTEVSIGASFLNRVPGTTNQSERFLADIQFLRRLGFVAVWDGTTVIFDDRAEIDRLLDSFYRRAA